MEIQDVRHDFPKNAGYTLIRPDGRNYYIFAHYLSPVTLTLGQTTYECKTGDCVLLTPNIAHNLFSKEPLIHNWLHIRTAKKSAGSRQSFFLKNPIGSSCWMPM